MPGTVRICPAFRSFLLIVNVVVYYSVLAPKYSLKKNFSRIPAFVRQVTPKNLSHSPHCVQLFTTPKCELVADSYPVGITPGMYLCIFARLKRAGSEEENDYLGND